MNRCFTIAGSTAVGGESSGPYHAISLSEFSSTAVSSGDSCPANHTWQPLHACTQPPFYKSQTWLTGMGRSHLQQHTDCELHHPGWRLQVFESTIRILGGLLSAFHHSGGDELFLRHAVEFAERWVQPLQGCSTSSPPALCMGTVVLLLAHVAAQRCAMLHAALLLHGHATLSTPHICNCRMLPAFQTRTGVAISHFTFPALHNSPPPSPSPSPPDSTWMPPGSAGTLTNPYHPISERVGDNVQHLPGSNCSQVLAENA
jgi:hypothetical protein